MSISRRLSFDSTALAVGFAAFAAYVSFALWILYRGHFQEDAYILYTYVEHLAGGDGIVYFAGGERAEGATDFLWMVLLAALTFVGVTAGQAAATLNGVGIGLIAYLLIANMGWAKNDVLTRVGAGLAVVVLLMTSEITAASVSGFSAAFYASIAVLILHVYLNGKPSSLGLIPWLSLVLGLIRPDGVIIGAVASVLGTERAWQSDRTTLRRYLSHLVGAGVVGGIYFALRMIYFGHTLPLPLYVKSYSGSVFHGFYSNLDYVMAYASLIVIAALGIGLARDTKRYLLAFVPFIALLAALTIAHQSQNIGHRFQAPVTGALFLSVALFLGTHLTQAERWKKILVPITVVAMIALATSSVTSPDVYRELLNRAYVNYFPFLSRDIFNRDTTIALTEAGRMAYWNEARTIDIVGLNTPHVAINKLDLEYLSTIDPDVIFVHTADTLEPLASNPGNTIEASIDFIDSHLRTPMSWQDVQDPVIRATYVTYEFLRQRPDAYRLIFASYMGDFSHLYAVKVDGNVAWDAFKQRLEASFDETAWMSYMDMKRALANESR